MFDKDELLVQARSRAERENPAIGVSAGERPELTLDDARLELATALSRVIHSVLKDRYGPLVGTLSEPTLVEVLKSFERNLERVKGDVTLLTQELLDRVVPPQSRRRR